MLNDITTQRAYDRSKQELRAIASREIRPADRKATSPYKVLIGDGHPLFREAVRSLVATAPGCREVIEASCFSDVMEVINKNDDLSLVLIDLDMPGMRGLDGLIGLHGMAPKLPVIIMSADDNKQIAVQAINRGAMGFITKSSSGPQISDAIRQILIGHACLYISSGILYKRAVRCNHRAGFGGTAFLEKLQPLTRRQVLVLERMAIGESNKQIGYHLHIAESTVKAHVSAIFRKLRVNNRVQAILAANYLDDSSLVM